MRTSIADSRSGLIPLARETTVNQSRIPLIYLVGLSMEVTQRWDSVSYPLDILERRGEPIQRMLGFSHLSP